MALRNNLLLIHLTPASRRKPRPALVTCSLFIGLFLAYACFYRPRSVVLVSDDVINSCDERCSLFEELRTSGCQPPLLTLFTTFNPYDTDKFTVNEWIIDNWAQLHPYVNTILYSHNNVTGLEDRARHRHWAVFTVFMPKFPLPPTLKSMFAHASNVYSTPYYGFANGDILFTGSLLKTLCYVHQLRLSWPRYILTGRRTNVTVTSATQVKSWQAVEEMTGERGTLFMPLSEDFFITPASHSWRDAPEFVVGRPAYDNYIIASSLLNSQPVIDLTETVLAVHVTLDDKYDIGRDRPRLSDRDRDGLRRFKRLDMSRNFLLAPRNFNYVLGATTCAPYHTRWSVLHQPQLQLRTISEPLCISGYEHYGLLRNTTYWQQWTQLCPFCRQHA